jgi:large subunit ribosomal protein L25
MADTLQVEKRDLHGKRNAKRLRSAGRVPAVIYGHGKQAVSVAVPAEQIRAAIRHGARVVQLKGAASDSALIRDLQYDTYGLEILHVDFTRVSAHERVKVKVPLELKGTAAGQKEGGMIEHLIHEIEIECPVASIPDKITVNIASLALEGAIEIGQIPVPEGIKVLSSKDEVAVHCVKPKAEGEEEAPIGGEAVEPELIRKEKAEEETEEKE